MKTYLIYTDGGASGNPGPAGVGVVICDEKKKILNKISEYIGNATNNQAEYKAVIRALYELSKIKENEPTQYRFFLDSELVVHQLNLKYKVKHPELQPLFLNVHNAAISLGNVSFTHIRREENQAADKLVKMAIKEAKNGK